MANNPNCVANLKPVKKGEVRNPKGKQPLLKNALKNLPPNMKEEVFGVLAHALTLRDEDEAKKYLECKQGELGQYGFVLQIAIKQLLKEGWGFNAMMDIFDRIYGRPKISADVTASSDGLTVIVKSKEEKDKLDKMGNLTI